jgi:hypothetical protein
MLCGASRKLLLCQSRDVGVVGEEVGCSGRHIACDVFDLFGFVR